MMRFKALGIQGFRSFAAEAWLTFPDDTGLHMLTGINKLYPRQGANGTGKSSVWDALVWCLYGKTVRGLKGPDVVNWGRVHPTVVIVRFTRAKILYTIMRTQDPNGLSMESSPSFDRAFIWNEKPKDPRIVSQEEVDALVGCGYEAFLASVMMGQFNKFFFDMSPTEKMDMFSEALQLGQWVAAAKHAGGLAKFSAERVGHLDHQLAGLTASVAAVDSELGEVAKAHALFLTDRKGRVKALRTEAERAQEDEDTARALMVARSDKLRARLQERDAARVTLRNQQDLASTAREAVAKLARVVADCTTDIKKIRADGAKMLQPGATCPTCCQEVLRGHTEAFKEHVDVQAQFVEAEREHAEARLVAAQHDLRKAEGWLRGATDAVEELDRRVSNLSGRVDEATESANLAALTRSMAAAALATAQGQTNPHDDAISRLEGKRRAATESLEHTTKDRETVARVLESQQYWAGGFKSVRLWLIENALTQLSAETNNCLVELGLEGWEIFFDVERETKAGTVSKGFTVSIKAPGSDDRVKWESWCGGETQRLRVAGALGLANLIRSRCGIDTTLEVWDEPTAHLSEEGVQDLTAFFGARAMEERRQIWIVDHRSLNHGAINDTYVVVRRRRGSSIAVRGGNGSGLQTAAIR